MENRKEKRRRKRRESFPAEHPRKIRSCQVEEEQRRREEQKGEECRAFREKALGPRKPGDSSVLRVGLPGAEEGDDVFGSHGAGGFEFATLLAEEEGAIRIKDGDGGDAAIERDVVFFGDVEVFIHSADVNVDH